MASNSAIALGAIARSIGSRLSKKQDEELQAKTARQKMVWDLVSDGLRSGTVKNPNEAFKFALEFGGGGKGKGGELPDSLTRVVGAIGQAGGAGERTMGGQVRPSFQPTPEDSFPRFYTAQELATQNEDQKIRDEKRTFEEITKPNERFKTDEQIRLKKATAPIVDKPTETRAQQLAAAEGVPDQWESYIARAAQEINSERQTKQAKPTTAEEKRGSELASADGKSWADLTDVQRRGYAMAGARAIESDRSTAQRNASQRLNAFLTASRQSVAIAGERYSEMKDLFPFTYAAKMAGAEVAQLRPDVVKQQLEKGAQALGKADQTAVKEADKIVQSATKLASSKAAKQSAILMGLGWDDDEATMRKQFIRELSGGQDPDAVEALAKQATVPVPTKPTGSSTGAATGNPFAPGGRLGPKP